MIYAKNLTELERAQFDFKLNQPPPWEDPDLVSPEMAAADAAAFMAAAASHRRTGA